MNKKNKDRDQFYNIKYIGYCWASLPPEEAETNFIDFVNFCKFQLCKTNHKLMLDPIWDQYNEEEIVAEYYAHMYASSKEAKDSFEAVLRGARDDIYDWLDKMVSDNQKEMGKKSEEMGEGFDFKPESIGD